MKQSRRSYLRNASAVVASLTVASTGASATETPPEWDPVQLYQVGAKVSYNGKIWEAEIASRNAEPTPQSVFWAVVSDSGGGGTDDPTVTASITASHGTVPVGEPVTFDASGSEGAIETYEWAFGDGATASSPALTHQYHSPGEYTVELRVSDGANSDTTTTSIVVETADSGETPQPSGSPLPPQVFAPYDHVTTKRGVGLTQLADRTGTDYFHLAFVLGTASGAPAWDGSSSMIVGESELSAEIGALRERGGDVVVAFGGAAGPYLAAKNADVTTLADRFEAVVDATGATTLDIDEEQFDMSIVRRRNKALAELQRRRPEVSVGFTLPATTRGLNSQGRSVITDAIDAGVTIETVNIMTMNYGWVEPNADTVIQSATKLHEQLQSLFETKSASDCWEMVGITPMIGVNNAGGTFYQEDANRVRNFASEHGVGVLSFWSVDRDSGTGSGMVSPTRSGIEQSEYEFSEIFAPYTSE